MDTTNTLKSMKKDCDMYFPKGEGIKIISTEEEVLINDTIYIMPTDCTYATMIVVDKCGNKRKIGVSLPDNLAFVDLFDSNNTITKEGNVYLKSQIDAKIEELKRDTGIGTDVLDLLRQLSEHLEDYNNPHRVTKEQVGLGNVDNTSDLDKPISKAQEQVNEKLRESISKQEEKACNAIAMVNVETTARTTADQNLATAISELKTIVDAINSWKTTLSQGDTNHMTDTLLEIIKAFSNIPNGVSLAEMFNQKLDKSSVVDNLTSILTNVPLSANQGQVLKTLIDCLRKDVDFALAWCTQLESIKIRKPQTTLRKPDSDYKYFVVLDEEGNSKRVLAGAGGSIPNNTAFIDHIERDEKGEVVENVFGNTYDKTQVDNKINELNTKISTEATERRNADSSFTIKLNELQVIVDVLQNWKTSFSNSSDDDNIINNIAELLSVFRTMPEGTDILELINTKVSISSIIDSLDSLLTNAPLSAHQGKVLKDLIDAINNSLEVIKGDINTLRESLNTKANKSDFDDFKRDSEGKFQEHERLINTKAGVDAENLREEDIAKWKQKLGVGGQVELPSNIATIDEGEKHGNTYTKTKIDELLENIGKNIANTDLQIPAGMVRTLNVEGAKFQISGLANKKTDASFSRRLKTNERGEIGYSDEADVIVNIPERFASTASIANTTITVNHIFPNAIPERPNFAEEIQKIMAKYSTYDFIPIVGSNYTLWTKDNLGTNVNTISTSGEVVLKGINEWNSANGQIVLKGKANVVLPADKDWILKIDAQKMQVRRVRNLLFGVCRTNEDVVQYGGAISGYDYQGQNHEFDIINVDNIRTNKANNATYLLIKKAGVITTLVYCGDACVFSAQNANVELGDFSPAFNIRANDYTQNLNMSLKMSYKILN